MDLNIRGLDESVGARLREQAGAAGLSVQHYLRNELDRLAARKSPAEFVHAAEPMDRSEFEAIGRRVRRTDAA